MSTSAVRRLLPICISLLVVAAVVAVVARRAMNPATSDKPSRITGAIKLADPEALTPQEQEAAAAGIDPESGVRLEAGAWVEVADPKTGRLAQRYSAEKVDPLPDQWVRMTEPRASFHSSDADRGGRVVTLRGRTATAHIPRRALESGDIAGDVVVQMFKPDATGRVDLAGTPALEVFTQQAQFDAELGQLRCEGDVDVRTPALRFKGRDLTMLLDTEGNAPERVVVETQVEPIRIDLRVAAAERGAAPAAIAPPTTSPADAPSAPATVGRPVPRAPAVAAASAGAADARVVPPAVAPRPAAELAAQTPAPTAVAAASPTGTAASPVAAASASKPASGSSASPGLRFYRLTLHDNVHIERHRGGETSTVDGDTMSIIFSMEGSGLRRAVAGLFGDAPGSTARTALFGPIPHQFAALALAGVPEEVTDELVITYTGRMVMTPTTDPADILSSPDDTRLEIVGSPVAMRDPAKSVDARCALLRYDTVAERLELAGSGSHPLEVDSPRAVLRGERLWLVRSTGVGRIEGPGVMRFDERPTAAIDWTGTGIAMGGPLTDDDAVAAMVASILSTPGQAERGRAPAGGKAPAGGQANTPPPAELPLEITWQQGVDLAFDAGPDGGEGGALREAKFAGEVRVAGEDFAMRSDRLRVGFEQIDRRVPDGQPIPAPPAGDPAPEDKTAIREIEAVGSVHVERLGERGEMDASSIVVTMIQAEGKSVPERMVAIGSVAARDANRTIRSEALAVTFRPKARVEPAATPGDDAPAATGATGARPGARAGTMSDKIGNVEINTVLAERDVRVQLEDGARVYADRLDGDSIAGKLALAGEDIVIVRDAVVVDRLKDVRFDDTTRTVHSPGPGRFRSFATPVELPPLAAPGRPALPETAPLRATWTESFRYDDKATSAKGTSGEIHLAGTVDVRSEPNANEVDTLASRELRLGLRSKPRTDAVPIEAGAATPPRTETKEVATMTAIGDAVLESKRWPDGNRGELPAQFFRVRGEAVQYNLATREAAVDSAGEIVLHDVTPPKPGTEGQTSFGSRGTSRFTWTGRMEMSREVDDRYMIVLVDGVTVEYAGTRAEDTLTLSADRLEITLRRAAAAAGEGERGGAFAGIDLGGGGEILRVRAIGKVLVRTRGQDVETVDVHEFDYNPSTGIALLRGNPQRQAKVDMKGAAQPLRADSMRWDMREGRVLIERAGGAGGR